MIERGVVYADDGSTVDIVHIFSGSELLPPFTVNISADGRLAQSPLLSGIAKASAVIGDTGFVTTSGSLEEIESAIYRSSLERANGNISGAARLLKISRAQLEYRLRKRGVIA